MQRVLNQVGLKSLALLISVLSLAQVASATTVIIPADDDLIIGARAIVRGKVISVGSGFDEQHRIFTYITLRVQDVLKGQIGTRKIVIKEEGGQVGEFGSIVFGTPRYAVGEKVLVYLDTWKDGSLRTYQMFLGKFDITNDPSSGREVVTRSAPDEKTAVLEQKAHGDHQPGTSTERMELKAYRKMVRGRLEANLDRSVRFDEEYYSGIPILARPAEYDGMFQKGDIQPQWTFISSAHPRWFEPDSGQPVVFNVNPDGAPNSQIFDDVNAAMNAWSTVPGCALRVVNGGSTSACNPNFGLNTIIFNACDGRWSTVPGCAGTLALGGLSWTSATKVINGTTFRQATHGFISFNPNASCHFGNSCNVRETATHELGHALGLGHSENGDATMAAYAHFDGRCASLRPDDVSGITFIYPGAGGGPGPLAIETATLPGGTVGIVYSQIIAASGGTPPYSWSVVAGSLPPGLSLNSNGTISGTPSSASTSNFTVRVTDSASATAQKSFSIAITSAGAARDSQFISQNVATTLNPSQQFTVNMKWLNTGTETWSGSTGFRVVSQNPPTNVTWGGNTVLLNGLSVATGQQLDLTFNAFAPSAAGTYNFQWQLYKDGVGFFGQISANVSITVGQPNMPRIDSPASIDATKGVAFTHQLVASGGTAPYLWSITNGALPAGISLNPNTGFLSGMPASAGNSSVTFQVTDSQSRTAQKAITFMVKSPPFEIATSSLPTAVKGLSFSYQLVATGGTSPYSWTLSAGSLPAGLNLGRGTGIISGVAGENGSFAFIVDVTDAESRTARKPLSITVTQPPPLSIEVASSVEAIKGSPFNYQPGKAGGMAPYTWSITTGTLPTGLALNASAGVISGIPSVSGIFNVGITIRDQASQSATGSLQIKVIDPATIPVITKAKYKAGKRRLTVFGERIDPSAVLLIDRNPVPADFSDGATVVKRLTLTPGQHEIRVVNPNNVSSQPYILNVN